MWEEDDDGDEAAWDNHVIIVDPDARAGNQHAAYSQVIERLAAATESGPRREGILRALGRKLWSAACAVGRAIAWFYHKAAQARKRRAKRKAPAVQKEPLLLMVNDDGTLSRAVTVASPNPTPDLNPKPNPEPEPEPKPNPVEVHVPFVEVSSEEQAIRASIVEARRQAIEAEATCEAAMAHSIRETGDIVMTEAMRGAFRDRDHARETLSQLRDVLAEVQQTRRQAMVRASQAAGVKAMHKVVTDPAFVQDHHELRKDYNAVQGTSARAATEGQAFTVDQRGRMGQIVAPLTAGVGSVDARVQELLIGGTAAAAAPMTGRSGNGQTHSATDRAWMTEIERARRRVHGGGVTAAAATNGTMDMDGSGDHGRGHGGGGHNGGSGGSTGPAVASAVAVRMPDVPQGPVPVAIRTRVIDAHEPGRAKRTLLTE